MTPMLDQKLLDYCQSERQREVISTVLAEGSNRKAALKLDCHSTVVDRVVNRVKHYASLRGYSPEHNLTHAVPETHTADTSTCYDADGNVVLQWVKAKQKSQEQALLGFVEGLSSEIRPIKRQKIPKGQKYRNDIMPSIFIGDAHIGMKAFGIETKHSNFDTGIAVEQLRTAAGYLIEKADYAETGLLVDVGDFMHANTQHNRTFAGTEVDVDTRHYQVMRSSAEVMTQIIDHMLTKFKNVVVVVARGNHNNDAAGAIQLALECFYTKEPRVKVLQTHGFYHYIEYGNWLLGIHHGDKQKPESLAGSMARDMAEAWGRTTHRMWCCGHFHKDQVKTLPGVKYKVFGALPPPDSWHAGQGYMGDGEMEMITFKRAGGIHSTIVYNEPQPRHEPDVKI